MQVKESCIYYYSSRCKLPKRKEKIVCRLLNKNECEYYSAAKPIKKK